jgi:NAD(P)H-nitrite reductase large subunit
MRIGIVGAGHAGVEAARQAAGLGAQVVLFSDESVLPYVRPRVVALAFGRVELDGITLRPQEWYAQHGIDLRLNSRAVQIDVHAKAVNADGQEEVFDALILATGASPALLAFTQEFPAEVIPIWGVKESLAIRERLRDAPTLVILGGGISGIESALYAREAGLEVTIVEKQGHLMPVQFGTPAAAVLAYRLRQKGIRSLPGRYAMMVSRRDGRLHVTLDDAGEIPCDLILTTVGTVNRLELFRQAGLRTDRGLVVDEHMQTSAPGVFACGDIAQRDGLRTATVVRANQHGRGAAENAVAFLRDRPLTYVPEPVASLSFKHADAEFHAIGPPAGEGFEEKVLSEGGESVYRSVLLQDGVLRGVQMVGSHEGFRRRAGRGKASRPGRDIGVANNFRRITLTRRAQI